jgi:hypothetical protein
MRRKSLTKKLKNVTKYQIFLIIGIFLCVNSLSFAGGFMPNLVGKWKGKAAIHGKVRGFELLPSITFTVEEQKGRIFKGHKEWKTNGKEYSEGFSGLIDKDNKQLYLVEHQGGIDFGEITDRDKIILYYLEDGSDANAAIYELKRVK